MLKYCVDQWEKNKENLREALKQFDFRNEQMDYKVLMSLVITHILEDKWDSKNFTIIDDGDYQGTLLFIIPEKIYQPTEGDYLMTYVWYGSCSCCDTMQNILYESESNTIKVEDLMNLALHMVQRMIHPFAHHWNEEFYKEI